MGMKSLQRVFGWPLAVLGALWLGLVTFVLLFDERDPLLFGPVGRRAIGTALLVSAIWGGYSCLMRWRRERSNRTRKITG